MDELWKNDLLRIVLCALSLLASLGFIVKNIQDAKSERKNLKEKIELKRTISELKKNAAGRKLPQEKMPMYISQLIPHKGTKVKIKHPVVDSDATALSIQCEQLLSEAGWIVQSEAFLSPDQSKGLNITVKNNSYLGVGQKLAAIFQTYDWGQDIPVVIESSNNDDVILTIGSK